MTISLVLSGKWSIVTTLVIPSRAVENLWEEISQDLRYGTHTGGIHGQ